MSHLNELFVRQTAIDGMRDRLVEDDYTVTRDPGAPSALRVVGVEGVYVIVLTVVEVKGNV